MHYAKLRSVWPGSCIGCSPRYPDRTDDMQRPPCWVEGSPCPNDCAAQHYRRTIYNETPLYGPWSGWRLAGARLISPHRDHIAPHLLDRWLWRHGRMFAD